MASFAQSPRLERRRAQRVLIRIPVTLYATAWDGNPIQTTAEATAVNRYGALIRCTLAPGLGSTVELLNHLSQQVEEFRIIHVTEERVDGAFEVGVEILSPFRNFWGIHFPDTPPA